jgi:hypothetical protein
VRAVVIRADHPEPEHALPNGQDEVIVDGMPVSIRLHLIMHEMVASELAGDDPPGVYLTAQRLLAAAYKRHELLHMLAAPIAEQIQATLQGGAGYDRRWHLAALAALPESYERAEHNERSNARTRVAATPRGDAAGAEQPDGTIAP